MKYVGKLFGQIGRTRGYFDTGKTSEDWDALEARAERAEAELKRYNDAVDAQPWASDEPIRVLLDRITIRLAAAEKSAALVGRIRRPLADAISTYDPNRKETLVTAERQEAWIAALQEDAK